MKSSRSPKASVAVAAITLAGLLPAAAQYGNLDAAFAPETQGISAINSAVPQSDGSILVAGQFTQIKDSYTAGFSTYYHIARFSQGGVLDTTYHPNVYNSPANNPGVLNTLVQPDDSAFYVGAFALANFNGSGGVQRSNIAKFNKTGVVNADFLAPNINLASITSLSTNQLGQIIISAQAGMYCMSPVGALVGQPNFYSYTGPVNSTVILPDQKILLCGPFPGLGTNPVGVNTPYLEMVSPIGRYRELGPTPYFIDKTPFSPVFGPDVYCTAVQADGKILVGGRFGTPFAGLAKILPTTGAVDEDFEEIHAIDNQNRPFIDGAVRAIAIQADGKYLIGGDFTTIRTNVKVDGLYQYVTRYGIARLNADGTFDPSFNANIQPVANDSASIRVTGITLLRDGSVMMTGQFERIGPTLTNYTYRPKVAKLTNYAATSTLTYSDGVVTWLRGGAAPETQAVVLEYKQANTDDWQLVDTNGIMVRTTGGWIRPVTNAIPAYSYIRASARTQGGLFNGSSGIVSTTIGYQVPNLAVSRSLLEPITSGSTTNLNVVGVGAPKDFTFTLNNNGTGILTGVNASISGTNANQFSIVTLPPATLAVGATTPLVIRFNPTTTGTKTATVNIVSNDPETPTISFTITGTATTALEAFRYDYFGITTNTGNAADSADSDGDGQNNLFEFVAGSVPNSRTSYFKQRVDTSGGTAKVIFSPRLTDRTYEVQSSSNLAAGSWATATGTNIDVSDERTFTEAGTMPPARFYRVKITRP